MRAFILTVMLALLSLADTTNFVVQINADGTQTVPPNTIATPAQVEDLGDEAVTVNAAATNIETRAAACADKVRLYGSNYVVTSTVYVQSIGGVPYDPSNQTIRVHSVSVTPTEVSVIASVAQTPLVPPALDWRTALNAGAWSNITATVEEVAIPAGATNAVKAYEFTLERPVGGSAFFRVVDNSTGASGSGLWWVVFGGISVDGQLGRTGIVTNGVDELRFVGGILVEPEPIGGL